MFAYAMRPSRITAAPARLRSLLHTRARPTAGSHPAPAPLEHGVLGVERERDEGEEAARLVLELADPEDVVDTLLVRLDVTVEDRRVRRDPQRVRGPVRVEPEVRMLFPGRDQLAHAVG